MKHQLKSAHQENSRLVRLSLLAATLLFFTVVACNQTSSEDTSESQSKEEAPMSAPPTEKSYEFNSNGELTLESIKDYRKWIYVGTPLTPNDLNPPEAAFPEFHNVYIHPSDYDYYAAHGAFKDGTILVKELVSVGATQAVSGKGYFQGEFQGLEATIKDSKAFPNEPGNWAYFSFGHALPLAKIAKAFETAKCNSCHQASAATDFVFTQHYPVLRAIAK